MLACLYVPEYLFYVPEYLWRRKLTTEAARRHRTACVDLTREILGYERRMSRRPCADPFNKALMALLVDKVPGR